MPMVERKMKIKNEIEHQGADKTKKNTHSPKKITRVNSRLGITGTQ